MSDDKYWLMKAEPESRIEKGHDVAFSAQHFEKAGTSEWDGVRNGQARNFMKNEMRIGDRFLFYHSNCKLPGIAAFGTISKEGHPDVSAWDESHPYYDPKTDKDKPTWYCVEVKFGSHVKHFVSLKLLQHLASLDDPPAELAYLTTEHLEAIQSMALLSRGRLSVQPVSPKAFEAIELLANEGGFEDIKLGGKPKASKAKGQTSKAKRKPADDEEGDDLPAPASKRKARAKKRIEAGDEDEDDEEEVLPTKKSRSRK